MDDTGRLKKARYGELVAHGVNSLLSAPVISKPFPQMAFKNVWPEEFYLELLAKRPERDNYVQLNRENTRRQFTLFDGSGDEEQRELWKLVSDVA